MSQSLYTCCFGIYERRVQDCFRNVVVAFPRLGPWAWQPCHVLVRVTKVHQHRLPHHLHSASVLDHGSPLAWMLGERGVAAASAPCKCQVHYLTPMTSVSTTPYLQHPLNKQDGRLWAGLFVKHTGISRICSQTGQEVSPEEPEMCCPGKIVHSFQHFMVHCRWHLRLLILLNSCTGSFH